jgi:hypothetical protein
MHQIKPYVFSLLEMITATATQHPLINYILIATNILVFIFLQDVGRDINFMFAYSSVPAEI